MSAFMNAMKTNDALTENGAVTHSTSGQANVDFFFKVGALRGQDDKALKAYILGASENVDLATRILLYARDVRSGQGERSLFRTILKHLCQKNTELAARVLTKVPELGRWDDVHVAFGTALEGQAIAMILDALAKGDSLCAKWTPRKGEVYTKLWKAAELTPKQLRKILVSLSNTVEQKMCARKWDEIEFGKLPSLASSRYQKAFGRRAPEAYGNYIKALQKGEAKINAGAVYPYDIIKNLRNGNATVANEQWKALPNYMEGSDELIIPVVDVSGSMQSPANRSDYNGVSCKDVAISIGMYIAERNEGPFKNEFISFSSRPNFHKLTGATLRERYNNIDRSGEDMSTNLVGCFKTLLSRAKASGLSQSQMPTKLLIMSDMEFNSCGCSTNFSAITKEYELAGYTMPTLVFWNIQARGDNVPVKAGQKGVALVSGCSPVVVKSVLGKALTPEQVMLDTVMVERYAH